MSIGVYYESWSMPWSSSSTSNDLANLNSHANTVYLSFAQPDNTYLKGQNTFSNTGLQFSSDFSIIVQTISVLRKRGVKVFLSVGGGSYWSSVKVLNPLGCTDLMNDLGCDGIDIDWEVGISDTQSVINAINSLGPLMNGKILSFTCFSTGANPPVTGDIYSGMNVRPIATCKNYINQVNVMAYDAGPSFDSQAAFKAYQSIYDGSINLGFEIGKQGWGSALLMGPELIQNTTFVKNTSKDNGVFFWAYYSQPYNGSISFTDAISTVASIISPIYPPPPPAPTPPKTKPTYSCPSSVYILCPTCKTKILNSWSI